MWLPAAARWQVLGGEAGEAGLQRRKRLEMGRLWEGEAGIERRGGGKGLPLAICSLARCHPGGWGLCPRDGCWGYHLQGGPSNVKYRKVVVPSQTIHSLSGENLKGVI